MPPTLRPIALAFVALGSFLGAWAVVAADLEDALAVGHGGFGLLLAGALAATAAMGAVAGALVERWGVTRVLAFGCGAFAVAVALLGILGDRGTLLVLTVVIVALFSCSGLVDVSMNVAATAILADSPGRLVRFHAFFNVGAAAGAGLTALLVHLTDRWTIAFAIPTVTMALAAVAASRSGIEVGETGERHSLLHAVRTVRAEGLLLLALVFALGAMVEGGIDTWGVLVLREQLEVSILVGAGAHMVGQAVAALARATLGPLAGSLGTVRGVAIGAGLAAGGLVMVALAPAPVAVGGLILGAAGVSMCWPMLLAHASQGSTRPTGIVSGVTAIGYLGFVLGPAVIGLLSDLVGLRNALLLLALAAATVAVAPRYLRPAGGRAATDAPAPG